MRYRLALLILLCGIAQLLCAQDTTYVQIPSKYFESISKNAGSLQENLDKKSKKELGRYKKFEERLVSKLAKVDSIKAKNILSDGESKYNQLQEKLKASKSLSQYIPKLDSLSTSLKFLRSNNKWISQIKDGKEKLNDATDKLKQLQANLQKAEDIKQFLKERKQYLNEQLKNLGFAKELKKINKQAYYYSQQLNEYKEALKDSKKAERKALELLSKTKLFKDFMRKNSMLASLFRIPNANDPLTQTNFAGLQTRAQVNSLIQAQLASGGPNAQQTFQQNIQQAQTQLSQLKDKIIKKGGNSSDAELPDFKPNNQKTKSFFERLELGTNVQSQRGNGLLPARSDIGLSIGYKLNNRSVFGIGGSYRIGWGNGWNDLHLSGSGQSLRSFLDWKLKGSFYISGGFEMNHYPSLNGVIIQARSNVLNAEQWQESGLIGISKIISVKSKLFKKTKAQLCWDFLAKNQIPESQSIIFRIGYNIK